MNSDNKEIRLHVYLARAGIASRRACEQFIADGRVLVNGKKITVPGTKVTDGDRIVFDGKTISIEEKKISIAINKPVQMLCSNHDDRGRPLVSDLFKNKINTRLFHAGRLDFMSGGLIIYTNDGELAKKITHPSFGVQKEYEVITYQPIPDELLVSYKKGINDDDFLKIDEYSRKSENIVHLILSQGKNREIRRVFDKFEIKIKTLNRIRIGIITLENIKTGMYRYLKTDEIKWFSKRKPKKQKTGK